MSYTLERFGDITLPLYNRTHKEPPASAISAVVATAAGAFDTSGSERSKLRLPMPITLSCILYEETEAARRTALDALRAAVGTQAWLYRRADDDGAVHRCRARLMSMDDDRSPKHRAYIEIKLTWQALTHWTGRRFEDWTFDDGSSLDDALYLDTGAIELTMDATTALTVGGNLPVADAVVTLIANDEPALQLWYIDVLSPTRCAIYTWADNPAEGAAVVVASGTKSVRFAGADNYDQFSYDPAHASEDWIDLRPGVNQVSVERGYPAYDSTATISYAEHWA